MTSEPTKAIKAVAAGRRYHISYGGLQDLQYVGDVAATFVRALEHPFQGADAFNLRGAVKPIETFVAALGDVVPSSRELVTHGDRQLSISLRPGRFEAPGQAGPAPSDESARRHRRDLPPVRGAARPGQVGPAGSGLRLDDVDNKNDASLARACCKVGLDRSCRRGAEVPVVLRQGLAGPPRTEAR